MRKTIVAIVAVGMALAGGASLRAGEPESCGGCCQRMATTRPATTQGKYVCPMGCASSDKPGKCPKCGMELVEKKQSPSDAKDAKDGKDVGGDKHAGHAGHQH